MTKKAEAIKLVKNALSAFEDEIDEPEKIFEYKICPDCQGCGEVGEQVAVDDYRIDTCERCLGDGIIHFQADKLKANLHF